jgi:hypothetical protein
MSLTLAKFLNEEADGALTSAQIVETTSTFTFIETKIKSISFTYS